MKRQPWFKFWFEARTDGKIRALPMDYRWIWVALLCYASEQEERGTIEDDVEVIAAHVADGDSEKFRACLDRLETLKLVTVTRHVTRDERHEASRERHEERVTICFPAFARRNDRVTNVTKMTEAERSAKYRKNKKLRQNVTDVTPRHADVTPETPSRAREEDRRQKTDKDPPNPLSGEPESVLPEWIPVKDLNDWLAMRKAKRVPTTPGAMAKAVRDLTALRAAGHDPSDVLQQSTLRGWTGLFAVKSDYWQQANGPANGSAPKQSTRPRYIDGIGN